MTISTVGGFTTFTGSSKINTLTINPTALGDILVVLTVANDAASYGFTGQSISGGGVSVWNQAAYEYYLGNLAVVNWGIITATGSTTLIDTVTTTSAGISIHDTGVQQFTYSGTSSWVQDGPAGLYSSGSGPTSGNWPSLVPANSPELYVACGISASGGFGGSTAGYTYYNALGTYFNTVWHTNAPNPSNPAFTGPGGVMTMAACLITPFQSPNIVMLI